MLSSLLSLMRARRDIHYGIRAGECDANAVDTFVSCHQPRRLESNSTCIFEMTGFPCHSLIHDAAMTPGLLASRIYFGALRIEFRFRVLQKGHLISSSPKVMSNRAIMSHTLFLRRRLEVGDDTGMMSISSSCESSEMSNENAL